VSIKTGIKIKHYAIALQLKTAKPGKRASVTGAFAG
jgi:hypothetical protein